MASVCPAFFSNKDDMVHLPDIDIFAPFASGVVHRKSQRCFYRLAMVSQSIDVPGGYTINRSV
jgi:hypothetical protein